jgi:hypothetical protein
VVARLGQVYALAGMRTEALEQLQELKQMATTYHVDSYHFMTLHLGLGERDQALEWLGKAFEERSTSLVFLQVDPTFDPLRSEPRFQDLLRRMNFPK